MSNPCEARDKSMNTNSAITSCRLLIAALIVGWPLLAHSFDFGAVTDCPRPPPGTVSGACEVLTQGYELTENSSLPFIRWAACLQRELGLPSGGYGDAVFFSELLPEWEREIDANLLALRKSISSKDQVALESEQESWQLARKKAMARV